MSKFRVIAINIGSGAERELARDLDESDAEAVVKMAVMRRGVEVEVYKAVPQEARP